MRNKQIMIPSKWKEIESDEIQAVISDYEEKKLKQNKSSYKFFSILFTTFCSIMIFVFFVLGRDELTSNFGTAFIVIVIVGNALGYLIHRNGIKNRKLDSLEGKTIFYQFINIKQKRSTTTSGMTNYSFTIVLNDDSSVPIYVDSYTYNLITKTTALAVTSNPNDKTIYAILPLEYVTPKMLGLENKADIVG